MDMNTAIHLILAGYWTLSDLQECFPDRDPP